jgi:Abi-like protein
MPTYEDLEAWFSTYRMAPYSEAAGGSPELAIRLYQWNVELSAAYMEVMNHAEVLLRNRIHEVMTQAYPDDRLPWFKQHGIFIGSKGPLLIAEAEHRVAQDGNEPTIGRIVASVTFGFWSALFGRAYSTLWAQTLHRCFTPHGPKKRERVIELTERIKALRNRIAHHERLIHRDLLSQHDDLLKIAMWIDPAARNWIADNSRVRDLINRRPA